MDTSDQCTWTGALVTGTAIPQIASGSHGIDGKVRNGYLQV